MLVLLAWPALLACRSPAQQGGPRVERLTGLGPAGLVRLSLAHEDALASRSDGAQGHQTRPAVASRSGERKACQITARRGSHLSFAVALEHAAPGSALDFEVRLGGSRIFRRELPARAARSFQPFRVSIESEGPSQLEFLGHIRPPRGAEPSPGGAGPTGRILIASARIDPPEPKRPRRVLVWISMDTVRADHLGLHGYGRATSPGITARAAEWVVFEEAMATAPWTLPSLVSQFTARHPSDHGAVLDDRPRDPGQPSVFQILSQEGFLVLGATGNRFVSTDFRTADGFDALWFTPRGADELTRLALRALADRQDGDLALFVHYMDPHFPYEPPEPFRAAFAGDYRGAVNGRNFTSIPRGRARAEDLAHVQALYDAELAYTDSQIEVLLVGLQRLGLLQDAVIVYSADHGESFLEHGQWLHTRTLYEELLHVPLALRIPGVRPARIARPVSLLDLAPTLLQALGIERPSSFQGRSLMPLLEGRELGSRPLLAETEQTSDLATHKLALRDGPLKYIAVARRDAGGAVLRDELFDLVLDPGERTPLPVGRAAHLAALARAYLSQARGRSERKERVLLAPEDQEALRALGYLN